MKIFRSLEIFCSILEINLSFHSLRYKYLHLGIFAFQSNYLHLSIVTFLYEYLHFRGSRCGGCRRVDDADRPYAFEVNSSNFAEFFTPMSMCNFVGLSRCRLYQRMAHPYLSLQPIARMNLLIGYLGFVKLLLIR